MTNEVLVCPQKNYFLGKDDVGSSKFNSRKEGVRGCRVKNEKGGGSDKDPTYSLCGRGVLHLLSAQRTWAETFRAAEPGEKELPLLPASRGASCPPENLSVSSHLPSQSREDFHDLQRRAGAADSRWFTHSQQVRPSSLLYSGVTKRSREICAYRVHSKSFLLGVSGYRSWE